MGRFPASFNFCGYRKQAKYNFRQAYTYQVHIYYTMTMTTYMLIDTPFMDQAMSFTWDATEYFGTGPNKPYFLFSGRTLCDVLYTTATY